MRKLIMWNLVTLDGMFEGRKPWDLEWHGSVWGPELEALSLEQLRSAAMLVFGRTTYQGMAAYWQTANGEVADIADLMNGLPKVVFSGTLANADWKNTRLVKGDAVAEMRRLKNEGDGNVFVFGSAILSDTFIKNGLFDEIRLAVTPIVLGCGTALFKSNPDQLKLKLIDARSLESGCVIIRYRPPGDQ